MSRASLLPAFLVIAAVARVPPADAKTVKPTKMTCQEFVDLDQTVRPEAVYWAEGYDKAKKAKADELGEVDLERDVAVIYEECKQAPRESVWAKIKKHL